jgi:hypothetical protein
VLREKHVKLSSHAGKPKEAGTKHALAPCWDKTVSFGERSETVARDPGLRQSLPPLVVGILLLACTVSGLATGVGVHRLVDSAGFGAISGTRAGTMGNQATSSVSPATSLAGSASPGGLPTVTASAQSTGFSLSAQVSPTAVKVGQQFSVAVTVIANDGSTPLGGVRCMLGPPANGRGSGPSLFVQWPGSVVSDSRGEGSWTLQAPNMPAGRYQLVVSATGTHGYYTWVVMDIAITR